MYAIVEIAGQQFKVEEGRKIFVHRLEAETGKDLEFDRVLLTEDNDKIMIGEPFIKDIVVEGRVLDHVRGDKVIVFKKKRRKGYRVKNGHRQNFTQIEIVRIGQRGDGPKTVPEKAVEVKAEAEKSEETVIETKTAVKKTAVNKTAEKKTAEKKVEGKKEVKGEAPAEKTAAGKTTGKKTTVSKSTEKKSAEKKPAVKKPSAKKSTEGNN